MRFCIPVIVFTLLAIGAEHSKGFSLPSTSTRLYSLRRNLRRNNFASPVLKVANHERASAEPAAQWANERQWLTWVYKRQEETPVGGLSSFVLKQMIPAMTAWARRKSPLGAERAESMMRRYVNEALAGNEGAVLNTKLFNIVMDGWVKSRQEDAPKKVDAVLRWMRELRQEHSIDHIRPDVVSMSTLVAAWAKSGAPDAGTRAEAILKYMEEHGFNPNTITYNTVLHAYATSPVIDKAVRAENLVQRMVDRYESGAHGECQPDVCTYQSLISAWARSGVDGAPQKAEEVLHFLECQQKEGKTHLAPNAHCFSAAIHAWSNSMEPEKSRRAYMILQHMRKQFELESNTRVKPNPIAFTSVINACASPVDEEEKEEALRIAQLTMEELRYSQYGYGKANFVTYAAFLNVCATTLPPGERRDSLVAHIFNWCCREGQVGWKVLEKLEYAASPELYERLVFDALKTNDDGTTILDPLPEWTRNVKGEKAFGSKGKVNSQKKVTKTAWTKLKAARNMQGRAGVYSQENRRRETEEDGVKWTDAGF